MYLLLFIIMYVLKNCSFNFLSNFIWQFLLQIKHLYSVKSSLKFVYSGKELYMLLDNDNDLYLYNIFYLSNIYF